MNKYTEPIYCLRKELDGWKQAKKSIQEVLYQNDSSVGSDNLHKFYKNEINKCDKMIKIYKEAIQKLKS